MINSKVSECVLSVGITQHFLCMLNMQTKFMASEQLMINIMYRWQYKEVNKMADE